MQRYWSPVNTPLLAEDGTVAHIVHRVQDVTDLVELRRAGREHQQAAAELQTRVEQMEADLFTRGRELQDTNRRMRQVNADLAAASAALRAQQQAKDRFIATLSHELRNPLASSRAALDVLTLDIPDHPARAVLDRQLTTLTRMTDDLLDAARVVTGRLRTARRPLDLRLLVAATVGDAHGPRTGDRPTIRLVQPDTPVVVDGDPVRLTQMLANLLDNAYKYTPAATPVTVALTTTDSHARIDVRDTGPGFTPEVAATLFDPFVRAATEQHTPTGLGLGLAVFSGIAESHDGTATAHSDGTGTGATFTVRLPLTHQPITDPEPAAPPPRPPLRILFIDDNEDLAAMYQRLLAERGDTVTIATTADAALTAARRNPYDLILCDLALDAGTDGYTIARRLRRSRAHRHTRLIAVSGFSAEADRARSHAAGFDTHLPKPLDPTDLDHLLTTWTDNWTRPLRPDAT